VRTIALLAMVCLAAPAHGADIRSLDVTREDDRFRVVMDVQLRAPAPDAFAAFTRYENLPRINPSVRVVERRTPADPDSTRLYTEIEVCVSFLCRTLRQVQDLHTRREADGWHLHAQVVPESSERLRSGHAHWHFAPCDAGTCLHFEAELQPAFWVPPLIGPWLIAREMRRQATTTAHGIERLAMHE
jgi:hypothetical protein